MSQPPFFGSAARFPHVQGMFAELFIASEEQCVAIPESTPFRVAACAEPLGVTMHAVARAGAMLGRKVLVLALERTIISWTIF